jgi:hypothetical protein
MKMMQTKKTLNASLFLLLLCGLFSLSCENPFKAGLGPLVDLRSPTIDLNDPGVGARIFGDYTFRGIAEDDYKIDYAELIVLGGSRKEGHDGYLKDWVRVNMNTSSREAPWNYKIETTKFNDGQIIVQLRVYDSFGKINENHEDKRIFYVLNDYPKIRLNLPSIDEDNSNDTGGVIKPLNPNEPDLSLWPHLNYGYVSGDVPYAITYGRRLDATTSIRGTLSYDGGINKTTARYRLWRVGTEPGEIPLGNLPNGGWQTFTAVELTGTIDERYNFDITLPEEAGFYGLEVWAQDKNNRVSFHYPRDYWVSYVEENWGSNSLPNNDIGNFIRENRYVLIYVKSQEEPVIVKFWDSEDILTGTWTGTGSDGPPKVEYAGTYSSLTLPADQPHEYVNEVSVNKNKNFIVRVNAKHSDGIKGAFAFWDSKENGRGIFIWDDTVPGKTIIAAEPFSNRGFDEVKSDLRGTGGTPRRSQSNFIFTYTRPNPPSVPAVPNKIFKYNGNSTWKALVDEGTIRTTNTSGLTTAAGWTPMTTLPPDTYTITVFAFGEGGGVGQPATPRSVLIDIQGPTIEMNEIEGAFTKNMTVVETSPAAGTDAYRGEAMVNGVIQPSVRLSDPLGIRDSGNTFFGVNGGPEQFYVLLDGKASNLAADFWPATFPPPGTIGGRDVKRYGRIDGTSPTKEFFLKTTNVPNANQNTDTAPNNGELGDEEYYLYIFARDKAFNVSRMAPLKINVAKSTDNPTVTFTQQDYVKNPSVSDDATANGFYAGGTSPRNKLGSGTTIAVKLFDDDSLDLGLLGSPGTSGTMERITITGVTQDALGNITDRNLDVVTLTDAVVMNNNIFTPQSPGSYGGRQKVTERTGYIPQSLLATALRGDPQSRYNGATDLYPGAVGSVTSLPDGIYRIGVSVAEWPSAKLTTNGANNASVTALARTEDFIYVVVDNNAPRMLKTDMTPVFTDTPQWITAIPGAGLPADSGFPAVAGIPGWRLIRVIGTVSDRNGPVMLEGSIASGTGNPSLPAGMSWNEAVYIHAAGAEANGNAILNNATNKVFSGDGKQYNATFNVVAYIHEQVSANFVLTIKARDRFNPENITSVSQTFRLDSDPPNVSLGAPIPVFTRQKTEIVGSQEPALTAVQYTRLTNGMVSFKISATDALSSVAEVRYWLLPSTGTPAAPGNSSFPATAAAAWDYEPAGLTVNNPNTVVAGKFKRLTSDFTAPQFIDTTKLAGADYCLYIMAKDTAGAGNISLGGADALKQTIFVNQAQDAPWFESNNLTGIVGERMLAIIRIHDDDGFYAENGSNIRPNTVRIWANEGSPPSTAGTPYIVTIPPDNITSLNRNNISVSVDLGVAFKDVFNSDDWNPQGTAYYIVEVTDSWVGKFTNETAVDGAPLTVMPGTPATDENGAYSPLRYRRQQYMFTRDTKNPEAKLTEFTPENTFGATPANFQIKGAISDAHLRQEGGDYTIGINLDSRDIYAAIPRTAAEQSFALSTANGVTTTPQANKDINGVTVSGDYLVDFTISNAGSLAVIDYTASTFPDGRHTLTIKVGDDSGRQGASNTIIFYKDSTPPEFTFKRGFNDTKKALPDINVGGTQTAWWTAVAGMGSWNDTTKTDYRTKRDTLPVIRHDGIEKPTLSGTFTDKLSNIASSFKIRWDGDTGQEFTIPLAGDPDKTVGWEVYLTSNGTASGTVLSDGVHSIQLYVEDAVGNILPFGDMYGFRIVSQTPTAQLIEVNGVAIANSLRVYGDRATAEPSHPLSSTVFTLKGEGYSPNLSDVRIRIRYTGTPAITPAPFYDRSVITPNSPSDENPATLTWTLDTAGDTLVWTLPITRSYIMSAGGITVNSTNTIRAGTYEVKVIAKDSANIESDETESNVWTFVVDSDNSPVFTFDRAASTADTDANNTSRGPGYWVEKNAAGTSYLRINNRNVIGRDVDGTPSSAIKGNVSDTMSNLDAVQIQLAKWDYVNSAWTIYKFGNTGTGTQNTFVTGGDVTHDSFWTAAQPAVTPNTSSDYAVNWAFTGVTPAQLTDGYYSVRLRARDVSIVKVGTPTPGWDKTTHDGNPANSHYLYFFIDGNNPALTVPNNDTYSTRYVVANTSVTPNIPQYGLSFPIIAEDDNLFESLKVSVERINTTDGVNPSGATLEGASAHRTGTSTWTVTVPIAFIPREVVPAAGVIPATGNAGTNAATGGVPDGAYKIVFEAVDLAGKTTIRNCTVTLDNRAPTTVIEEPRFQGLVTQGAVTHRFASDPQTGGEPFTISGTADDAGLNSSASGPKEIWYRIGYGTKDVASLQTLLDGTENAAARSAKIAAWVLSSGDGLDFTGTGAAYDKGVESNPAFETAAKKKQDSLWFKYVLADGDYTTATTAYDVPALFANITSANVASAPYAWTLTAQESGGSSVATNYALGNVTFRGRTFVGGINPSVTGQALARKIDNATLPDEMQYGLYSLPLVIRVVDEAGNASYELRDIWLYPNGDNPRSKFLSPFNERYTGYRGNTADGVTHSPRGGQFNISGIAEDNVSVRTVLYRVKVDNKQAANNAAQVKGDAPAGDAAIVAIPGATEWTTTDTEHAKMHALWTTYGNANVTEAAGTGTLSRTGWYVAKWDSKDYDPTMSWYFTLNAGNEITSLIPTKGFTYSGAGMIRVWVEVLVFDGDTANAGAGYHLMSLGDSDDAAKPRPYVTEFYVTASAPTIDAPRLSNLLETNPAAAPAGTLVYPTTPPALVPENNVRGGRFGVRATLNSGSPSRTINQIHVRLRGEEDAGWRPVYIRGETLAAVNGVTLSSTTFTQTTQLTYVFDSTADTSTTAAEMVRGGKWARSGGTFTVDVRVRDNASPSPAEAIYTFEIGVDNFAPIADTVKNITNSKVAGSNAQFMGRAFDYRTAVPAPDPDPDPDADNPVIVYRKIKEVRVWFTQTVGAATRYIRMTDGNMGTQTNAGADTPYDNVWNKPDNTVAWSTTNNGNDVASITHSTFANTKLAGAARPNVPTTANYFKVISESSGSGTTWSPSKIGTEEDVYWSFVQDTSVLPDGWIKMHYIVVDQANNRSYYTQDMLVCNNYPIITNITLYTDNTGEGAVFTTHEGNEAYSDYKIPTGPDGMTVPYAGGYLDSGFISKNSVIGFGVSTTGTRTAAGNTPLYYQARFVERYLVPLTKANMRAMANRSGPLTHLVNAAVINPLTGAPSDNTPIASPPDASAFVDLYTIAPGQSSKISGGDAAWRILGVPSLTPKDGSHFVFRGISQQDPAEWNYYVDNNVERMDFSAVYVYAYKQVLEDGPKQPETPPKGEIAPNLNRIEPEDLNFSDSAFGNTSATIREAQANNATNAVVGDSSGTAFFLIKVYDSLNSHGTAPDGSPPLGEKDRLYDAVVIGMKVYVGDIRNPYARLYDLNPYLERNVENSNVDGDGKFDDAATQKDAADPTAVGANIKRGGLYNIGTNAAPIKSGYIDPRINSTALNPWVSNPSDPLNPYTAAGVRQQRPDGWVTGDSVTAGPTLDTVSGKIILRGFVWDDQLIDQIQIKIGSDAEKPILELKEVYVYRATGEYFGDTATSTQITDNDLIKTKIMRPYGNAKAWAFDRLHWKTGHTVEWAYLWDTEVEPASRTRGGPLSNIKISVIARDLNSDKDNPALRRTSTEVAADAAGSPPAEFHNTVNVDIVPYITGFKRADHFANTRSRQGWYSFFRGETGIRVVGFNLGSATANATTVYLNSDNAAGNGTALTTTYTTNTNYPNDGHTFSIPTDAESGRLTVNVVRTGGTPASAVAYNHSSRHNSKSWNKESSSNARSDGSDLWINKPYAHIWRSQQTALATSTTPESTEAPLTYFGNNTANGGSWDMESPSMALEYGTTGTAAGENGTSGQGTGDGNIPGRLHGVWAHRSTFKTFYGANDMGAAIRLQEAQDPQAYTDLAYYPGINNANNLTAVYVYQWDALPNLLIRTHMRNLGNGANALGLNPGGTIAPFLIRRDDRANPTDTRRWQNVRTSMALANTNTGNDNDYHPHNATNTNPQGYTQANTTAARGNAGRVYTVGYDSVGRNVFFVERVGFNNYPAPSGSTLPVFIDGGTVTTGTRAGMWSAVDYVTVGGAPHPVVVYYHETSDTLRLAYGNNGDTANNNSNGNRNNWTIKEILTGNLRSGSGKYVSMKVDNENYIHLAFYNSTYSTVVYAKSYEQINSPITDATTLTFVSYAVDRVVKGGVWTDISVDDDGNPWITYGDNGRAGNYDGIRVAYRTTASAANGGFTHTSRASIDPLGTQSITGWEAVTMPSNYTVSDDRLNIEVWPPTDRSSGGIGTRPTTDTWNAAVGYAGTSASNIKQFRISYFFKPANAVVNAFQTTGW